MRYYNELCADTFRPYQGVKLHLREERIHIWNLEFLKIYLSRFILSALFTYLYIDLSIFAYTVIIQYNFIYFVAEIVPALDFWSSLSYFCVLLTFSNYSGLLNISFSPHFFTEVKLTICLSLRNTVWWLDTHTYWEMITTILFNIYQLTYLTFCCFMARTLKL